MSDFGNPISLRPFVNALAANYDAAGIFHVGGGRWIARCAEGVLLSKDGAPYESVEAILKDLATVGVRRIAIEWDGLAASLRLPYDVVDN